MKLNGSSVDLFQLVDHLLQTHRAGHVLASVDVFLTELRHQDLAVSITIAIIDDPDEAVLVLHTVWIGDVAAFIEQQAFVPSDAIIGGESCGDVTAAFEFVMVHQQQIAPKSATLYVAGMVWGTFADAAT